VWKSGITIFEERPMLAIQYRVTLGRKAVEMLEALLRQGASVARKQTRIPLKAAAGA
jgi:hypothetical protein